MNRWEAVDVDSGIKFAIELSESGKYFLNCTYNNIKVDIRNYEFRESGLYTLLQITEEAIVALEVKRIKETLNKKPKKVKKK